MKFLIILLIILFAFMFIIKIYFRLVEVFKFRKFDKKIGLKELKRW